MHALLLNSSPGNGVSGGGGPRPQGVVEGVYSPGDGPCGDAPSTTPLRGAVPLPRFAREENGFSLIEALVALAVLAIATVGLMRTVESHIDSTRAMERRTTAMWVAENRMAELQANAPGRDQVEMMGQQWRVAVEKRRTDDPEIERVRIQVFAGQEKSALASLDGFVDGRKL